MDCGCDAPYIGPSLAETCGGGTFVLFMSLLNTFVCNKCDLSEICGRVTPRTQPDPEYDFVVIGGGSGGSTAAGRLAEEKNWKVLLIEAGGDEPPGSQVPSMVTNYFGHPQMDWGYKTEPERGACLGNPYSRCQWIRGKVLGGCSVLNGMMYMRGTARDYDNWAAAGNAGWGHNDVLHYFKRAEDNQEIGTLVDAKYHGRGGPLTVARFPDQPELAGDVLIAGKELGYPVSRDLNGAVYTGFAITQTTNRNGTRLSAARAFVRPHRHDRNFHVMLNSTATKITVQTVGNKKKAVSVQVMYNNVTYTVRVRNEVIVAGGAINSPQILMLSGIGPQDELRKVNVPVVHHLPGVGQNLHNHVTFYLTYSLLNRRNLNDLDWATALDYLLNRRGPMSSTGMSQVTARLNSKYADPRGDNPDLQIFFGGYTANCAQSGEVKAPADPSNPTAPRYFSMSPVVLHPKSRGNITLKSNNPLDHPLIYANYLSEPEDVKTLVEGIRVCQRLGNTTVMRNKYGAVLEQEGYEDCIKAYTYDTDDFWDCAVRYATGPENHQVGSCKMGPSSDPLAVVNHELQVHGIENIRVMDASVFPQVVSGNTAATVMMVAEKGVDMIKRKWLRGPSAPTGLSGPSGFSGPSGPSFPSRGAFPEHQEVDNHHQENTNTQFRPSNGNLKPTPYRPPHPYRPEFEHNVDFHKRHPHMPNPFDNNPYDNPYTTRGI